MALNPVVLEVLWTRLISVADEAAAALMRTSFSTIVRESYDFSCIISDAEGNFLVQATESIPSFIGTLPATVRHFMRIFPAETLKPGDVMITNDPWIGTGHLPDLTVVKPIFRGETLIGYTASTAHSPDMGGKTGSSDIRDVFEEGFQLPPLKLMKAGQLDETLVAILRTNVRVPDLVMGDLWAQIGALEMMEARLLDLMRDYNLADLKELSDEINQRSEQAMRQAIRAFPAGRHEYELKTDGFEDRLTIRVAVEVKGDEILVDYAGTSPQIDRGINVAYCYTYAMTVFALKCLLSPDLPNNEGTLRPIRMTAPEGCLVNHTYPYSGQTRTLVGHALPSAIFGALAGVVPEKISAASGSPLWSMQATGINERGRPYVNKFFFNGGTGATHARAGYHSLSWPSNISNVPIEMMEQQSAFQIRFKRIRDGSGGSGAQAGGCGQEVLLEYGAERPVVVGFHSERTVMGAPGVAGGGTGEVGVLAINGRPLTPAEQKRQHKIGKGDTILMATPGGGGYGVAGA